MKHSFYCTADAHDKSKLGLFAFDSFTLVMMMMDEKNSLQ